MSPHNIDVFEDFLYITLYNQSIIKLHKFGIDNGTVLLESFHRSSDIMIMHPLKQDSNSKNNITLWNVLNQTFFFPFSFESMSNQSMSHGQHLFVVVK